MLESREGLVGKAHHEQADPAEDLSMPVRVDLVQSRGGEGPGQADSQQQPGAPHGPQAEHDRDAGLEERAINGIGR